MKIVFVALVLVCLTGCTKTENKARTQVEPAAVNALLAHLAKKSDRSSPTGNLTEILAMEAGPQATSALKSLLRSTTKTEDRVPILTALAYSGGPEAEAHLRLLARGYPPNSTEMVLWLFSVPSSDSRPTTQELMKLLPGESYGDEWPRTMMAVLALGVIGDREALPALQEVATKNVGRGAEAAKMAATWIGGPKPQVDFASKSNDDELIALVVAHPPEAMSRAKVFCEAGNAPRTWLREAQDWRVTEGCLSKHPVLQFKTARSSDGKRALVSFSAHFGQLDAIGYDYILWLGPQQAWSIRGVINTWIS